MCCHHSIDAVSISYQMSHRMSHQQKILLHTCSCPGAACFTNMISNFIFYHVQVLVSALLPLPLMLEINITNCLTKCCINTVKPVLSGHSKIDRTKILMTNGSLMKVKVLQNAPIGAFCNIFDLH